MACACAWKRWKGVGRGVETSKEEGSDGQRGQCVAACWNLVLEPTKMNWVLCALLLSAQHLSKYCHIKIAMLREAYERHTCTYACNLWPANAQRFKLSSQLPHPFHIPLLLSLHCNYTFLLLFIFFGGCPIWYASSKRICECEYE